MNISPEQVRAAARAAADVITADQVPPLRLDPAPGRRGLARWTRTAWVTPAAAAAAVVLVIMGSLAATSWFARPGDGRGGHLASRGQGHLPGAAAGAPPYYVAVESRSAAVVRATATGDILATITTRTPFVGVTGAADDRTFVLDAQRQIMGPTVRWPGHPAFYLLRLTASGTQRSLTRLAIAPPPAGTAVTGLALSPDGRKLAVEVDTQQNFRPGLLEIRVYTLATGAFRTWFTTGSADPVDPGGFTGSGVDGSGTISWAADSTTLALDWQDKTYTTGVRLLDTAARGGNLIGDSRLAVIEATSQPGGPSGPPRDHVSQCVTDSIMSLDGSAIVCGYTTNSPRGLGRETTTGFLRYSTRTGRPGVLSVFQFRGQFAGDISLYWTDPTGHLLIGGIATLRGRRVGVIDGKRFTPLPGVTALGAAAW